MAAALAIEATIAPVVATPATATAALAWEPYSSERLGELLRAGRPVSVDFTAAWCVTCQVNERLALATPAVTAKMRAIGVVPVRADWTRPNPDIARALQEFGRDGVPLYVLYSRRADPPRILPQIPTSDIVLTELEQLEGVIWLTMISSAPGKQGYVTPAEEDAYLKTEQASPTAVLLDPDGKVGRLYGAKTTPHMFVIDAKGVLVYAGAIDDKPSSDPTDVDGAKNFVRAAYEETKAGKAVSVATTPPYGCSVKYAD